MKVNEKLQEMILEINTKLEELEGRRGAKFHTPQTLVHTTRGFSFKFYFFAPEMKENSNPSNYFQSLLEMASPQFLVEEGQLPHLRVVLPFILLLNLPCTL